LDKLIGKEEYPVIANMAVMMLLPFPSTYLCELELSTLTDIKTSKRKRLRTMYEEIKVDSYTFSPHISLLCSAKQAQTLH
jgi:hypothetical protein